VIVIDTDFLSTFIKINRLELILAFFRCTSVIIPLAVLKEIDRTDFFEEHHDLLAFSEEEATMKRPLLVQRANKSITNLPLGEGEREAISLAVERDASLLMNDKAAMKAARSHGVNVIDTFSFLLACHDAGFVERPEMERIVRELESEDSFRFRKSEMRSLLG